ncbi:MULTISPECIES: lysylphosphatidylglycerol synthase domain-containing protein [Sphingobacterium]|uniref:lysylphosphatidylglycerol synthase domain-containing protein n=1 Tax=Sphingobacterium TaxID=28453 RepID=UPI000C0BCC7D|nr:MULTISPECIES: lysylphosphatidylglycerol synthase domain-containing protein [Sphingobacterium]MCT1531188.1 lysylphosphatidylglycerol synthase domain-containing protein [Sphingobacterium daejeonense]
MTQTQRKYLNLLIKIAIVALAMWFVVTKVNNQKNLIEFEHLIHQIDPLTIRLILFAVVLLMFVNWFLEVIKWRFLSRRIEKLSIWKATKSVFCGLTWAIFTPNRIGEYGGRVMLLKPENRATGAVAMGVGLFAQLVLTSVFGSLSIAWFVTTFIDTPSSVDFGIWIIAVIYALAFVILYFNVSWVDYLVGKVKFLQKIKPFFAVLEDFSVRELAYVLFLSAFRFAIFTSQYIILMLVILPDLPIVSMVLMIFIMFFIQSAVPSLDIFDFSVRSFVASNLYAYITTQEIAVMAIVSCVWFVNLIFPAIIGAFFVFNVNYISDNKS